jgi:hypothetical protein
MTTQPAAQPIIRLIAIQARGIRDGYVRVTSPLGRRGFHR